MCSPFPESAHIPSRTTHCAICSTQVYSRSRVMCAVCVADMPDCFCQLMCFVSAMLFRMDVRPHRHGRIVMCLCCCCLSSSDSTCVCRWRVYRIVIFASTFHIYLLLRFNRGWLVPDDAILQLPSGRTRQGVCADAWCAVRILYARGVATMLLSMHPQ